jgi:adenosylcobinamide kinase/adenosylcobinamide-phosphate guanylyltransferase
MRLGRVPGLAVDMGRIVSPSPVSQRENAEYAVNPVVYDPPVLRKWRKPVSGRAILVLGGARSGKSRYAEGLAAGFAGRRAYIATPQPGDVEMAARISAHRAARALDWATIEAPLELVEALEQATGDFVLIDCLTLWISNLLLADLEVAPRIERLALALKARPGTLVMVSNEVGLGIVPDNPLARRFRDEAGLAHQHLAKASDEVIFMTAGLPARLKP